MIVIRSHDVAGNNAELSIKLYIDTSAPTVDITAPGEGAILRSNNVTLSWSSSDPGVATVDEHGLVTVVGPGTATITVSTVVGEMTATCIVNSPNQDADQSAVPAGAGSSNNGEPEDPAGPAPEAGLRFLAEKEAAAGQEISNISSEQSGSQPWRVFEMSAGAVPLQRQQEPNSLDIYEVIIFLVLFLFGSVKKYREYTREVAR